MVLVATTNSAPPLLWYDAIFPKCSKGTSSKSDGTDAQNLPTSNFFLAQTSQTGFWNDDNFANIKYQNEMCFARFFLGTKHTFPSFPTHKLSVGKHAVIGMQVCNPCQHTTVCTHPKQNVPQLVSKLHRRTHMAVSQTWHKTARFSNMTQSSNRCRRCHAITSVQNTLPLW